MEGVSAKLPKNTPNLDSYKPFYMLFSDQDISLNHNAILTPTMIVYNAKNTLVKCFTLLAAIALPLLSMR